MTGNLGSIEEFRAYVAGIKTSRGVSRPISPLDVTDLVDLDREKGLVHNARITVDLLKARWPGVDVSADEEFSVMYDYRYTRHNRTRDENTAYSPDPDGIGRFGWRKPGMHVRRKGKDDQSLSHGPGKRKKSKRK